MGKTIYEKMKSGYTSEIDLSNMTSNNYLVVFSFLPDVQFWSQSISFPGVTATILTTPMPHGPGKHFDAGTAYDFDPLTIRFLADEMLEGWRSIYDWITNNTKTRGFASHSVDAGILLLTNAKKPFMRVEFENVIPNTLTGLEMDSRLAEVLTYSCTFKFTSFNFYPIKNV